MKKALVCILDSMAQANMLVGRLARAGFAQNDISVLFPDQRGTKDFAHEHNTKAPEGAVAGAGIGGVAGAAIGALAGLGAIAIPGLGLFIAAGPLLGALSGAAGGASIGGVAGALVGMGIPEIEAKRYEGKIRGGNILVSVHTENAEMRKVGERIMKEVGAVDVDTVAEASTR